MDAAATSPKPRHACDICFKTFARPEHLTRHSSVHVETPQHICVTCNKIFRRSDALHRHELIHQQAQNSPLKGLRACVQCVKAKTKCDGCIPCARCLKRAVECQGVSTSQQVPKVAEPVLAETEAGFLPATTLSGITEVTDHNPAVMQAQHLDTVSRPPVEVRHNADSQLSTPTSMLYRYGTEANSAASIQHAHGPSQGSYMPPLQAVQDTNLIPDQLRPEDMNVTNSSILQPYELDIDFGMNWLSDLSPDFDTALFPLTVDDSYYFNNFPQTTARPVRPIEGSVAAPSVGSEYSTDMTEEVLNSASTASDPSGTYYVENESGRLPRGKRRRLTEPTGVESTVNEQTVFSLEIKNLTVLESPAIVVTDNSYQCMKEAFQALCIQPLRIRPSGFGKFSCDCFPTQMEMTVLVRQYWKADHPVLPILHLPTTLDTSQPDWLLLLCMAALGSHHVDPSLNRSLVASMHEFVRRIVITTKEDSAWRSRTPLCRSQIIILHALGIVYCGDMRLRTAGLQMHQEISEIVLDSTPIPRAGMDLPRNDWQTWVDEESKIRAHYAAWYLDCLWQFHHHKRPFLRLQDIRMPLPCHERVWEAPQHEWPRLMLTFPHTPSLISAVQSLHVSKRLQSDLGEFSRILLIHGIFSRAWEVEAYFGQNLSSWTPSANRETLDPLKLEESVWLPSIPLYRQWRSSACDCLDVLHWNANATIGNAAGIEHATVLHLHLARVVLLTPFKEIQILVEAIARADGRVQDSGLHHEQVLRRWACMDGYKARLAMIHAGVVFWHVRRFSINGFYEPAALGLATLALWAFSTFSPRSQPGSPSRQQPNQQHSSTREHTAISGHNPANSSSDDEDAMCNIILLDRPTDDELVQRFVVKGNRFVANMDGIGDLYSERAPRRVLQQGLKILYTLHQFSDRSRWIVLLSRLLEVVK